MSFHQLIECVRGEMAATFAARFACVNVCVRILLNRKHSLVYTQCNVSAIPQCTCRHTTLTKHFVFLIDASERCFFNESIRWKNYMPFSVLKVNFVVEFLFSFFCSFWVFILFYFKFYFYLSY